jgi:hypothetical protein
MRYDTMSNGNRVISSCYGVMRYGCLECCGVFSNCSSAKSNGYGVQSNDYSTVGVCHSLMSNSQCSVANAQKAGDL